MKNKNGQNGQIRRTVLAVIAALSFTLTGCGAKLPEMTDTEYNAVVNYAAGLLMRYAKGTNDRLTFLDTTYTPEHLAGAGAADLIAQQAQPVETQQAAPEETLPPPAQTDSPEQDEDGSGASTEALQDSPAQETDTAQTDEATGDTAAEPDETGTDVANPGEMIPAPADEPVSDIPQTEDAHGGLGVDQAQQTESAPAVNAVPIEASSLQSLAGGATIEYTGYSVRNAYPDSQTQGAVTAAYGDKLLVVDFTIHNLTGASVRFNTASLNPQFKLQINGDVQGFTLVTMIENDLGGMDTEIAPGGHVEAVLLMEVPESLAKNVDTLDLMVVRGAEQQTIKLE